jgi:ferredoxin
MGFLSASEKQTLALIGDTFIPALEAEAGDDPRLFEVVASDFELVDLLEDALERTASDSLRFQLRLFLRLLENGLFNGIVTGHWRPFSALSLRARTDLLYKWATSRLEIRRTAFQGFKRLTLGLFYMIPEKNPTWPALKYDGPPAPKKDTPRPIVPLGIDTATTLDSDVLIIGSGAGGGVVAGELSAAGFDVIIAEKGGYYAEQDFHGEEMASNDEMFENHGVLTTADTAMQVLAGSTLGGGTTINWAASFRPPDAVLDEWEHDYGFSGATSVYFQRSLDAVTQRIHVNSEESVVNPNNLALTRGCERLGYAVGVIPRNVKGCEECGFCGYGCPYAAKQSTLKTYLVDAFEQGARILVRAQVNRILHQNGVVTGAMMTVQGHGEKRHEVGVRARIVVVAAGAIHTPALLRRSGLRNAILSR